MSVNKKMFKRMMSMFLSLVMLLSVVNMPVSAAGNGSQFTPRTDAAEENIRMHLFDYGAAINKVPAGTKVFNFYNNATGGFNGSVDGNQSRPVMKNTLVDGYPYVEDYFSDSDNSPAGSLKYLFNTGTDRADFVQGQGTMNSYTANGGPSKGNDDFESMRFAVANSGEGTGLFREDAEGYLYYSSGETAAYFNQNTRKFELYDYIERPNYVSMVHNKYGSALNTPAGRVDVNTLTTSEAIGAMWAKVYTENFFPFTLGHDEKIAAATASDIQESGVYTHNGSTNADPEKDRDGQTFIKHGANKTNLWFGMNMEFDFVIPEDGKVNGNDMVFEFLGDDDVYVYVDDALVLDIGDDHYAEYGTINFATGEVVHPTSKDVANGIAGTDSHASDPEDYSRYTLYDKFEKAGIADNYDWVDVNGDGAPDRLADYTKLNLKFFYLERGGYYSYCSLRFNIQTIPSNSVTVEKKVEDVHDDVPDDQNYKMRLYVKDQEDQEYSTWGDQLKSTVKLEQDDKGYYFNLKDGAVAQFSVPVTASYYVVEECGSDEFAVSYKYNNEDAKPVEVENGIATSETYAVDKETNHILVTNRVEKTTISGSKTWEDNDNQDGKRPESITVKLLADGVEFVSKEVTAADEWKYSFEDVPVYNDNGEVIIYTIQEVAVDGYEVSADGYNLTNTHTPSIIDIEGSKTWEDNNNQDGVRPESITVRLFADGVELANKVVTAADLWKWTFEDYPEYKDGKKIVYEITEDPVTGYTTEVDKHNVINTHIPETISVSGEKIWDDADNQDGVRPNSITVKLLANGVEVESKEVTAEDGWKWNFEDVDKYADGKEIIYTVEEEIVSEYTTSYKDGNIVNKYNPKKTYVYGQKIWDDDNDRDGIRPDSITVKLLADGVEVDSKVVTEADKWTWNFEDLDEFRDGGIKIEYTVEEEPVEGYTTDVSAYDITNTHELEKTSVKGTKIWEDADDRDGIRPDSITVNLYADGEFKDSVIVTEATDWSYEFTDLLKFRNQGTEIVYTVEEEAVEGYESTLEGTNIINTHEPITTIVSGSKTWDDADNQDGIRPDKITVNLLADGNVVDSVTVTEENDWTWTFEALPVYRDHGVEIVYTVEEEAVEGYETLVDGFSITNTHEPEVVSVAGSKTWDDEDDKDGIRPESITIKLLANGEVTATMTVTEEDDWAWTFKDLPKFEAGEVIEYTIDEVDVEGYEKTIDGYNVTNTHEPEEVVGPDTGDHSNIGFSFLTMICAALVVIKGVLEHKRAYRRRR